MNYYKEKSTEYRVLFLCKRKDFCICIRYRVFLKGYSRIGNIGCFWGEDLAVMGKKEGKFFYVYFVVFFEFCVMWMYYCIEKLKLKYDE